MICWPRIAKLLLYKAEVNLLNKPVLVSGYLSVTTIVAWRTIRTCFLTVPLPPLLSIIELHFLYPDKTSYLVRLKLDTIVPTIVGHLSLGPYFFKNEQGRCKLSIDILAHRTLYLLNVIVSSLTGKKITILSESSKKSTLYS